MAEFLSVALVCAGTLLAQECTRETALDIIVIPARSPMECVMYAQTAAASAGLPGGEDRYLKIGCERRKTDVAIVNLPAVTKKDPPLNVVRQTDLAPPAAPILQARRLASR